MWIHPTNCEITPLWDTIKSNKAFVLQKSKATEGILKSLVGTIQSVFESKQAPFRILLKNSNTNPLPGDILKLIAVENSLKDAIIAWNWLNENFNNALQLDDYSDIDQYVCSKIEVIVNILTEKTDESSPDEQFRNAARSFRNVFDLPDSERLVNCNLFLFKFIHAHIQRILLLKAGYT